MPKEVVQYRLELSGEGEIIEATQETGAEAAPSRRRFPSPLSAFRDRRAQKELERKAEAEALEKEQQEAEFQEKIETILIDPIKGNLRETFRSKIVKIFEQHRFNHGNNEYLFHPNFEYSRSWSTELRVQLGPKFLRAINGLFLQVESEIPNNMLSDEQIATSTLLTAIIAQQQAHLIEMGYPEDLSELGVSAEEILQELQEYALKMYHSYIEQLNQYYFCAYGEYKDKRKRS